MAGTGRKNANLMNLIKRVHGVVENTDIEKHRQSQDHFGALLGNNKDVIFEDVQIQALTGNGASADEEIPFTDNTLITIVPTFFIDGLPVDTDRFCKENEIAKSDLLSFLTSEEYLSAHTVVYQYLRFTWTDGLITEISSEAMDYNADAAYYNAN